MVTLLSVRSWNRGRLRRVEFGSDEWCGIARACVERVEISSELDETSSEKVENGRDGGSCYDNKTD